MSFVSSLVPSGVKFTLQDGQTILESALSAGVQLAHSCKSGQCGTCKARLISGNVLQPEKLEALSQDEVDSGYVLTCLATAESDIQLEADYFPELADIKPQIHPTRVESIEFPAADVAVLKTRLPPATQFKYLPGQYVDLIFKGIRRSYSIANIQQCSLGLEFHIRKVPNGEFSGIVFNELKTNDLLRFEGPVGTFFYRKSDRPIVFIAGGTGFAPIKALMEHILNNNIERDIRLYWGATSISGFYSELPRDWEAKGHLTYIPVLSGVDTAWKGRRGLVHEAVLEDVNNLSGFDVYVCGSPELVKAVERDLPVNGLDLKRLFSDSFIYSY